MQTAIVALTVALFWFAFIYYPRAARDLQDGKAIPKPTAFKPAVAQSGRLPVETENYRVAYEDRSGTYYVFVNGDDLEEYVYNRDNAKLSLKNALSVDKLCSFNVIYVSTSKLSVPTKYLDNSDC
ncbi:MAG: hypothetical protein WD988_02345 [Candidatus Curtissbacteria bacterium]